MKSTVDEIRAHFDANVERFSSLESGHTTIMDSVLMLSLLTQAAAAVTPGAKNLIDIGCGAGNYSLKQLELLPDLSVTLVDLSLPMLERAEQRLRSAGCNEVHVLQGDIRDLDIGFGEYDIILAGAVLHHLRSDEEWRQTFAKCFAALRPGGGLWIADLIDHDDPALRELAREQYSDYLLSFKDAVFRDQVFAKIEQEDTPRDLTFQLDTLRSVGFTGVHVLHKNGPFAAFGAVKGSRHLYGSEANE